MDILLGEYFFLHMSLNYFSNNWSFRLRNQFNNKINAPASDYGKLGHVGFVDYASTCTFLEKNNITPVFDESSQSPYATKFLEWISYDDVKSLQIKADYIKKHNFGGAMIYSLNTDDHVGACGVGNESSQFFPLVHAIRSILNDPQL